MKTTIYNDTMPAGNQVKVEVNRYAKGYWQVATWRDDKATYEYELVVNGKVEYLFRDTLRGAKNKGFQTLCLRWAEENRN